MRDRMASETLHEASVCTFRRVDGAFIVGADEVAEEEEEEEDEKKDEAQNNVDGEHRVKRGSDAAAARGIRSPRETLLNIVYFAMSSVGTLKHGSMLRMSMSQME
jgi:hypothetical protein